MRVLDVGNKNTSRGDHNMFKLHRSELLLRALSQYPLTNGVVELGLTPFADATIYDARS